MRTKRIVDALEPSGAPVERPAVGWRDNLITTLLSAWAVIGLYVDGWAHNGIVGLESFFTPWHGILYAGIGATGTWMSWHVARHQRRGAFDAGLIPAGYGLGLVGLVILGIGAVTDAIWHEIFGFDSGVEAPFSPPHQVLFMGGLLVASVPLRAAWSRKDALAPTLRQILPALLSLTLTTAVVVFFLHYHTVFFRNLAPTRPFMDNLARFTEAHTAQVSLIAALSALESPAFPYLYYTVLAGTSCILITNLILLAPVLVLMRRWRPPFGSVTVLFTTIGVMASVLAGMRDVATVIVVLVGGLAGDIAIAALRPSDPGRMAAYRVVAALIPLALWTTYFAVIQVAYGGVGWTPALWIGTIMMSCLSGVGLSLVIAPSAGTRDASREASAPPKVHVELNR